MMEHSGRRTRTALTVTFVLIAFAVGAHSPAAAQTSVTYRWDPSPTRAADGTPLPPAVSYQVFVTADNDPEVLAAVVGGTSYELATDTQSVYRLRVRGVDAQGRLSPMSEYSDPFIPRETSSAPPAAMAGLGPAYPNPFNPATVLTYRVPDDLAAGARVSLEIFDMHGRRVRTFEVARDAGEHQVTWRGDDVTGRGVPAGVYVARYICGTSLSSTKLTLVR